MASMNLSQSSSLLSIIFVISMTLVSIVESFKVEDCNRNSEVDVLGRLNRVDISGCPLNTKDPACIFLRNTDKTIKIEFTPKIKLESVKVSVSGKLSIVQLPFPVRPNEACGNYGLNCPLEPGKQAIFTLKLPILNKYPKFNVGVTLRLRDDKGHPIICINFPARIKDL